MRKWAALGVLALALLLIAVDGTVLALALPALQRDLAPSTTEVLWIGDVYSFVLGGLLVTMGTLGDRIGRKRLLLTGAFGFGAGVAARGVRAVGRVADRGAGAAGRRGGDDHAVDAVDHQEPVHRPRAAHAGGGGVGGDGDGGCRTGAIGRRGAAGALLVGLGVHHQPAGDGAAAGVRLRLAARVARSVAGAVRPDLRRAVGGGRGAARVRDQGARTGRAVRDRALPPASSAWPGCGCSCGGSSPPRTR